MGKKKSTFKNIMVTLGCTAFASLYVLGGGYVISTLLDGDGNSRPAWLERVEIHVDETAGSSAANNSAAGGTIIDNFNSRNPLQKPRFDEKEEETETETETTKEESEENEITDEKRAVENHADEGTADKKSTNKNITEEETLDETEIETEPEEKGKKSKPKSRIEETEEETETESELESEKDIKKHRNVEIDHVQVIQQEDQALAVMADVTAVVKAAMPCVVSITNEYTAYDYWYDEEYDEQANGSGIVVAQSDEELLIVTNYHVIEDNNNLYVQFNDDKEAIAYVKGTSPENDLAIVSVFLDDISDKTLEGIAIAALGDSDSLQVGEPAIAIGNSLGYGQSVTTGVISALNRNVFADEPDMNQGYLIQTDAAINPGNSGGALLNIKGEVIGINSSKIADYVIEGMGYAIPISTAKPIIEDLMQRETRKKVPVEERAFLGITGTDVIAEATARYEMPEGVFVLNVLEDTAADKAGIKKGDIICYIDGVKVTRMDELQGLLEYYAADTEVEIVLMRQSNGEYKERIINVIFGYKQ